MNENLNPKIIKKSNAFIEKLKMCAMIFKAEKSVVIIRKPSSEVATFHSLNFSAKEVHDISQDIYVKTFNVVNPELVLLKSTIIPISKN